MKKKSKVKILAPTVPGFHLSACTVGTYLRFLDHDERNSGARKREKWNTREAYQYIGRVGKTKYAKVLHVDSGRMIEGIPCTTQVTSLKLVSIELQPEDGE